MVEMSQKSENSPNRRVFIVRPWHRASASNYPFIMDGVEYVDAVIHAFREAFPRNKYEIRVDSEVFVPGESLRENIEREIKDAEIVLALLDGLRPNVIYELGIAHALQHQLGGPSKKRPVRVIPLAEINATVLVRNFYPEPFRVPMKDGTVNNPINPPLNLAMAWSDGSDILVERYDRLRLQEDITNIVSRIVDSLSNEQAKGAFVSENASEKDNDSDESENEVDDSSTPGVSEKKIDKTKPKNLRLSEIRDFYKKGEYVDVIKLGSGATGPKVRKIVALSYMKLGRISEAMEIWTELQDDPKEAKSALFHLGLCNFAINELLKAHYYFSAAKNANYGDLADTWLERTKTRLGPKSDNSETNSSGSDGK